MIAPRELPIRQRSKLQVSSQCLFSLDADKQSLEVSDAEAAAAVALDDLKKERRAILHGGGQASPQMAALREDFKEIRKALDERPEPIEEQLGLF